MNEIEKLYESLPGLKEKGHIDTLFNYHDLITYRIGDYFIGVYKNNSDEYIYQRFNLNDQETENNLTLKEIKIRLLTDHYIATYGIQSGQTRKVLIKTAGIAWELKQIEDEDHD